MLFQLVNHAMVDCLANPQQNVMVSLFTPCEMLHLQGLHPYSCEAFSSYLSGSMAEQPFLRQAEDTGIPNSLCSYHKIFIGAAQRGSCPSPGSSSPPPWPAMPTLTFRHMAEFYGVPHFALDVPLSPPPRRWTMCRPAAADGPVPGPADRDPVDEGELVRAVARSQRTMALFQRGLEKRRGKQVLSDLTSELFRTAAFHFLLGCRRWNGTPASSSGRLRPRPPPGQAAPLDPPPTPTWVLPCGSSSPRAPGCRLPPAT